ncbi:hypothetical protein HUG15_05670 [Salicibibacter cibarius]|uniref:Uncharacterized protein n=1 Tax=Salicibibacter cibarius TaxID=2743000 RepID=A0A7T6Z1P9_9BACI|nr:hypothetical protein [Salicibibacter cibarius]QQK75081.1 hypothetical protein HUG15_05335 [Salicibibacter cibarius]QQK75142.1 hypothetical protein HUG15_05670 [Salicibibacter cibarius]
MDNGLIDVKDKALVFVQEYCGEHCRVFQDGKELHGVTGVRITADEGEPTYHEIEYLTGKTNRKNKIPEFRG